MTTITASTRYHGPTDTRGARIVVKVNDAGAKMQRTVPYDHEAMGISDSHHVAIARALGYEPESIRTEETYTNGTTHRFRVFV